MFQHLLSAVIREGPPDDTQEVPEHVGDGVSIFTFQCMYGRFDKLKMVLTVYDNYRVTLATPQQRRECGLR